MLLKKYFIFSATVLSLMLLAGCGTTPTLVNEQYDALAKHLTESGFKMYGTEWCGACKRQKELFGSSFQYINYEECSVNGSSKQTQVCKAEGIEAYPTWELPDGTKREGIISIEEFKEISKFSVEE